MKITQTRAFIEDCEHYTKLGRDYMHTSRKEEIRAAILKLEHMRGADYVRQLAAKCNQR